MIDGDRLRDLLYFVHDIPGAVSMTEMAGLYKTIIEETRLNPADGFLGVDFGSHAGKTSTTACAALAARGGDGTFFAVDPCFDLTNEEAWKHTVQGTSAAMPWGHVREPGFNDLVHTRIKTFAPEAVVQLVGDTSTRFLNGSNISFSYVFIDSDDHQPELVIEECKLIMHRVFRGGLICFHDYKNQYIGPAMAAEWLVKTGEYEFVHIDWPWARDFVKFYGLEAGNLTWQCYDDMATNFVGAVRRK